MQKLLRAFLTAAYLPVLFISAFSQDQCVPVGWATQGGTTTGGGSATPVTVTTLSSLQSQASSSGAKVIYVSGVMGSGVSTRVSVAANKTIIGLPGATLYGGFDVKSSNIIIRNMIVRGPGAVDVDGVDCITIDGSSAHHIWIDHCDIYDGQDGNMDISNGANYIAVTWCKFRYTSASSNHQFCNLFGSSDSKTSDRGKLKITMMYNWWTTGCKERMPRLRFGQVHMVNNYFNCTGNNHCIRAGIEADLLVESNYFDGVKTPIDLYEKNFTAVTSRNNVFVSTSGNTAGSGTAFTPPYSLTITPAANVKSLVSNATCGAGATMTGPTSCGCGTPATYTLSTNTSPSAGGTVTRNPDASSYSSGTVVTLTATPAAGYTFTGWSGDAGGSSASTTVTMNANKTVTANFQQITYTLTTSASPSAGGSVSRNPNASSYASGTQVTLTATPAAGYTFTGWSGDASGSSTTTTVTMNSSKTVTANFQQITYTLATNASPSAGGSVSRNPNASSYASGTSVTLTATPAAGFTFSGWSGDATGSASSTSVIMDANKTVTATFTPVSPNTYTLGTTSAPSAGGTVSGGGVYNSGTVATITATPAAGYSFTGWSGDAGGNNATTTVTMDANKSVTANFALITYTLSTASSPAAGGTVSGGGTYNAGGTATITATPAAGYVFSSWSGDASGSNATTTIAMNGNKSVTANFIVSGGTSTIRIEDNATTATGLCLYEGSISSNSGASNGKVINLTNSTAKGVNWRVTVPSAGSYGLNWRYVNSSSSNTYSMKLIVNGVTINAALPFPKTSSSSVFANTTATVSFVAGNNDIRIESIASNATADIDWIEITGNSPAAGNCAASLRAAPPVQNLQLRPASVQHIYPNPAKEQITIGFVMENKGKVNISIVDEYGRVIDNLGSKSYGKGYQQLTYQLTTRNAGMYMVMITSVDGSKRLLRYTTVAR